MWGFCAFRPCEKLGLGHQFLSTQPRPHFIHYRVHVVLVDAPAEHDSRYQVAVGVPGALKLIPWLITPFPFDSPLLSFHGGRYSGW